MEPITNDSTHFDCSLYQYLKQGIDINPSAPVLAFMGQTMSGKAFLDNIADMAGFLALVGVKKGTVVTLVMPNLPSAIIAFYAINYLGARCSVLHPLTPPGAILREMRDHHSNTLLFFDKLFVRHAKELDAGGIRIVLLSASNYRAPIVRYAIKAYNHCTNRTIQRVARSLHHSVVYPYRRRAFSAPMVAGAGDDICLYLHSGGTTGVPKTVPVTHTMLNASSHAIAHLNEESKDGKEGMLMVLPIFHGFGIGVCMHASLAHGIRVIPVPAFKPRHIISVMRRYKVSIIAGVPTVYEKLLATGKLKGRVAKNLHNAYCGGDTLPVTLKERFDTAISKAGGECKLYQGYGMAECVAVACACSRFGVDIPGSIGTPLYGVEMCILDADGHMLADRQEGEIAIAGPTVMQGYLGEAESTAIQIIDGKRWLRTGDCGYRIGDVFYYAGRYKRMSIIAGVNVYHQQIEQIAGTYPGVRACAVTEYYRKGKVSLCLWLEAEDDGRLKEAVLSTLRSELTKYAVPRLVRILPELPRTKVGKVDYRTLEKEV